MHKNDVRYNIIEKIISKKIKIIQNTHLHDVDFYFELFLFDICNQVGLCYDYNFSYANTFEICYYDIEIIVVRKLEHIYKMCILNQKICITTFQVIS